MKRSKVYTWLEYDFDGALIASEGYEYVGPWALATETQEVVSEPDTGGEESVEVEAEPTADESDDILGVTDYEDPDEDAPKAEPKAAAEPEGEEEEKEEKKEPVAAEPKPVEPTPDPKPAEPAAATPAAEPAPATRSPEELRAGLIEQIASRYEISEEDAELLQTDPAKILPQFAARVMVDAYEAIFFALAPQLPKLIKSTSSRTIAEEQNRGKFFDAFPELNDPKYAPTLDRAGALFREQNPNATTEEAITRIGNTAMAMLGLERAAPASPAVPAAPAPKPRMPSVPAAARTGAGGAEPKPEENFVLDILDHEDPDY